MPEITKYAPGMFCWFELGTSDSDAAKKFYSKLFGWTANDMPAGPDMVYTMLQRDEKDIGAMYSLSEAHKSQGVPPHWLTYISVASADESAAKAKELGGTVIMDPFDVFDAGRMALVEDPTGAKFAIWQANNSIGARLKDEPNSFCWSELATRDTAKATEFYTRLFGWDTKVSDMGPMTYTEFINDGTAIGGMLPIAPEWGDVPANWMGYVSVDDCDGIADEAKALGAEIKSPPMDIPHAGRFAVIQDPQGAAFAIIKLALP
jgi:predicted enzyme related to lactoylglutathione lyase